MVIVENEQKLTNLPLMELPEPYLVCTDQVAANNFFFARELKVALEDILCVPDNA